MSTSAGGGGGSEGGGGSTHVTNATKFCLSWRKAFEFLLAVTQDKLQIKPTATGNIFGAIMAFIRRCKSFMEICQSNAQLFRYLQNTSTNIIRFPIKNIWFREANFTQMTLLIQYFRKEAVRRDKSC